MVSKRCGHSLVIGHRVADCYRAARITLILLLAFTLRGQTPSTQPLTINTDRPAFADASTVVPKNSLTIENGFLDTSAPGHETYDFPESQWRFGLLDKTELRFAVPDYYSPLGWSDSSLGVKQQLGPLDGIDLALVVTLSFPSGSRRESSHGYDPSLQLPWSRKLSTNWTMAGMLSVYWPTQRALRNTTGQATLLFDRQLTSPWDAFVEYGGLFPERGGPQHLLHFGTSYKLTPRQQLDLHGGVGLSAAAPGRFVGFGYSVLLGGR